MVCPKCGREILWGEERQDMVSLFGEDAVCNCDTKRKMRETIDRNRSHKDSDVTPHPLPPGKTPSQTVKNE